MKKVILSLTVLISAIFLTTSVAWSQGVNFQEISLTEAIAKAKAENKHVFIDIYTDWCGPCKLMASQVFPMKELGDYFNPKFISVDYNGEKNEDGKALVAKYKISAYPTFIILDGDGNMIHLFAGGVLSVAFIDKVKDAFNPDKAFGNLQKRYDAGERDKKMMCSYIQALMNSHTTNFMPLLDKFADSLSTEELICNECLFIFDDLARLGSPREEFYTKNLDKFRAAVGREKADTVLKKKFEGYYASILGNQRVKNAEEIESVNKKLAGLGLAKTEVLTAYQVAIKAVMDKEGADEIVKAVKAAIPKVHSNEIDVFLYYAIPAAFSILKPEQVDELMAIVKNQNVLPKIESNVKRLREKAAQQATATPSAK